MALHAGWWSSLDRSPSPRRWQSATRLSPKRGSAKQCHAEMQGCLVDDISAVISSGLHGEYPFHDVWLRILNGADHRGKLPPGCRAVEGLLGVLVPKNQIQRLSVSGVNGVLDCAEEGRPTSLVKFVY